MGGFRDLFNFHLKIEDHEAILTMIVLRWVAQPPTILDCGGFDHEKSFFFVFSLGWVEIDGFP